MKPQCTMLNAQCSKEARRLRNIPLPAIVHLALSIVH